MLSLLTLVYMPCIIHGYHSSSPRIWPTSDRGDAPVKQLSMNAADNTQCLCDSRCGSPRCVYIVNPPLKYETYTLTISDFRSLYTMLQMFISLFNDVIYTYRDRLRLVSHHHITCTHLHLLVAPNVTYEGLILRQKFTYITLQDHNRFYGC